MSGEPDWSFGDAVPEGEAPAPQPECPPDSLLPGDRFGPLEVVARLGQGGMGVVYEVRDPESGRPMALKLLGGDLDRKARERFRREGQLTATLRHPGIVGVHAGGELGGVPYLIYELVPGGRTLRAALRDMDRAQLLNAILQVAEAVGHAHAHGVVHRDLKPENVLLDSEGRPRVADFGLARHEDSGSLTASGALVGTPTYMPPEQICGEGDRVGPPSDVWALGVMLYQSLTGRLPFDAETLYELSAAVVNMAPAPPRALAPDVSADLEAVCLMALSKAPEHRYADAGALAADLRNALESRPVLAASRARRAVAWTRGQGRFALAVALVLLAVGGALWAVLDAEPAPGVPPQESGGPSDERRGDYLVRAGRPQEAAEAYRRALNGGASRDVRLKLAGTLLEAGDLQGAREAVQATLAAQRDAPALRLLAQVQVRSGRLVEAQRTADALRSQHPGCTAELLAAEVVAARGGDPRALLREAHQRWPARLEPRRALARAELELRGDLIAARQLLGGLSDSVAVALRGISDDPPDLTGARRAPAWVRAAGSRWLLGEGLRDMALLEQPPPTQEPEACLDPGVRRRRGRELLEAAVALADDPAIQRRAREALEGDTGVPALRKSATPEQRRQAQAVFELARAKANPISIASCEEVLALDPDHAFARYLLGRERFIRREYLVGLRDCMRGIVRSPRLVNDLCAQLMAVSVTSGGLLHTRTLNEVLEGYPEQPGSADERAGRTFLLAIVAVFEAPGQRIEETLDRLQRHLDERPPLLWPRVLRAFLNLHLGRLVQVERDLRIVSEAVPDIGVVEFLRALLVLRRGEHTGAVRAHLDRARERGFLLTGYEPEVVRVYPDLEPFLLKRD